MNSRIQSGTSMKYKPQGLSRLLNKTLPISGDKIKNLNDMLVSMKVD